MKRFVELLSILLIVCGFAFASGGAQPTGAQEAPGEVLFWSAQGQPAFTRMQLVVDAYNATNPAVKVNMIQVPGSETDATSLMTAVRGGTGPDVYYLDRFTVTQRASDGILEDITDELEKIQPGFMNKYLEFARQEASFKGRVYALPHYTDTRGLYINVKMLRDAGVDPALLDHRKGPPTIDQVREIVRKINTKDAQGNYTKIGFIPQIGQGWHYTWGFDFGGEFVDFEAGKVTPTHPGIVAAFQFLYDWNKELGVKEVQSFIASYMPPNNPPQNHPFITGHLAMMVMGDNYQNNMAQYAPDIEYDCTYIPIPQAGSKPSTWAGGASLVLPTGTKQKEAAVRFVAWACGEEGSRIFTKAHGTLSPISSLVSATDLLGSRKPYFQISLPFAQTRPPIPVGALYWDALSKAQDMVVQNAQTPLQALQEVEATVQPQLNRFLPLQ